MTSHLVAETLVLPVQLLRVELLLLQELVLLLQPLYGRLQLPVLLLQLQHAAGDALVQLVDQRLTGWAERREPLPEYRRVETDGLRTDRWRLTLGVGVVVVLGELLQLPAQVSRLVHALLLSDLQQHVLLHQLLQPSPLAVPLLQTGGGQTGG